MGGRGAITISLRSMASAESRLAGLLRSSFSEATRDLLRSSWIRVFLLYTFSISRHEPPLELRIPLRPLGSGGSPSMEQTLPPRQSWGGWRPFIVDRRRGKKERAPREISPANGRGVSGPRWVIQESPFLSPSKA